MSFTKENWQHFRKKEWHGLFAEIHLASWAFGFGLMPTGMTQLYCIDVGCFSIGYEYKSKALRRAIKQHKELK